MPPKHLSSRSRSLAAVRTVIDWDQSELARAAGLPASVISDYERGHRNLSHDKLEELFGYFGLPPEATEWAIGFAESVRNASQAPGQPGGPETAQRREIERIAASMGNRITEFGRSTLTYFTVEGRAFVLRQRAPVLWRVLKRHPPAERRRLVESTQELRSWALCELICAESIKAAADNADRAVELADLALVIAELTPLEKAWRSRIQGYAWAHVGNARRVRGDLPGAEQAFLRARKLWEEGEPGDPGLLNEAQLLSLEASLRISQGRLVEAENLLDKALKIDRGPFRAHLIIMRARLLEWAGDYESALKMLSQGTLVGLDKDDLRLLFMLRHNYAWNLTYLGREAEAALLLPEIRALTARLENELDTLRLNWLEARVAAGQGRIQDALSLLSQVRSGFTERGITYDAALVTLELAILQLERGRTWEVKVLARQLTPIFQAQGVGQSVLVALRAFYEAAEMESATVELARRVVKHLLRVRYDPDLRFEAVS